MNIQQPTKPKKELLYISFSGNISTESVANIEINITNMLAQFDIEKICFLISSPWGNVRDGIQLYNFLKSIYPKIIMYNVWSIDSIANVIFLAGEERYAYPNTSFLFHWVKTWWNFTNWVSLNDIREMESSKNTDQEKIAWIIANNSDFKKSQIIKMFNTWKSIDVKEALKRWIIGKEWSVSIWRNDALITITWK